MIRRPGTALAAAVALGMGGVASAGPDRPGSGVSVSLGAALAQDLSPVFLPVGVTVGVTADREVVPGLALGLYLDGASWGPRPGITASSAVPGPRLWLAEVGLEARTSWRLASSLSLLPAMGVGAAGTELDGGHLHADYVGVGIHGELLLAWVLRPAFAVTVTPAIDAALASRYLAGLSTLRDQWLVASNAVAASLLVGVRVDLGRLLVAAR